MAERLDLRLRLGPGLRLHTLDPFLIPRLHFLAERLDLLERLAERLPDCFLHMAATFFMRMAAVLPETFCMFAFTNLLYALNLLRGDLLFDLRERLFPALLTTDLYTFSYLDILAALLLRLHPLLFFHAQFFLAAQLDLRAPEHGARRLLELLLDFLTIFIIYKENFFLLKIF